MLPADDTNLENLFTWSEYVNVSLDDGVRVAQTATDEYATFLFKDKSDNSTASFQMSCNLQSDLAPTTSTVYLQVYNRTLEEWETVDSDNTTAANTDFTLTGTRTIGLSDYYDANHWIACRVYQEAV